MPRRSFLALVAAGVMGFALQGSSGFSVPRGYLSSTGWTMASKDFGGISGIEVADDGMSFVAVGDKGVFVVGSMERNEAGRLQRVAASSPRPLLANDGLPLPPEWNDSEGLTSNPAGGYFVSFEGEARVLAFPAINGPSKELPRPFEFGVLSKNAAFEALALAPDGTLLTMPEELPRPRRVRMLLGHDFEPVSGPDFPVWRFDGHDWDIAFTLPRRGTFLPVGADFGPDGRLYVLERAFHGVAGFASRVRRFDYRNATISSEFEVLRTQAGVHDNLEALSVWRDAGGKMRLTMVSDNNFMSFQRTEIVEYRIDD